MKGKEMNRYIGWILLLGGLAIIATVWFGMNRTSEQSDAEKLRDAMLEMQANEAEEADRRIELRSLVLSAPDICKEAKTAIVFDLMEGEPDPGQDWPDWTLTASPTEQACIEETVHQTNEHAFRIRGEVYAREPLSANRTSRFISDLASAALWTDGIDYGDKEASLYDLINGYYANRAESRVKPEQDY